MNTYISRIIVYLICFIISLFGLQAFDFNRLIKKNKIAQAWVLYFILAFVLTYILGQFMFSIIIFFNK